MEPTIALEILREHFTVPGRQRLHEIIHRVFGFVLDRPAGDRD
jgi:hypothetical protein